MLKEKGIELHSVIGVAQLLDILVKNNRISQDIKEKVLQFVANNQVKLKVDIFSKVFKIIEPIQCHNYILFPQPNVCQMTFEERAKLPSTSEVNKRLFEIMTKKKTNLCLAADVDKVSDLLQIANICGPHIAILKVLINYLIQL